MAEVKAKEVSLHPVLFLVLYYPLLIGEDTKSSVDSKYFKYVSFTKHFKTNNVLNIDKLLKAIYIYIYIWCYVDPSDVFLRPLYRWLLILPFNLISDNDVPFRSATASARSWWMDQSCSSELLRGLCSCAVR